MIILVPEENTDSRMTISVRVDCKIQRAEFVDNQRKSRLCSIDFTDSSTVLLANCRKNSTK